MSSITPFDFQASTNIDEHNQIVDKVNEIVGVVNDINLDGLDDRLNADEADISQLKISDQEHTSQIDTIDGTLDTHAREINALKTSTSSISSDLRAMSTAITEIKTKDQTQDTEISGLTESVVSDLVATFTESTRTLKLSIERESAASIDASVVIPAGGGGGTGGVTKTDITSFEGLKALTSGTTITARNITLTASETNKAELEYLTGQVLAFGNYVYIMGSVYNVGGNNGSAISYSGPYTFCIFLDTRDIGYSQVKVGGVSGSDIAKAFSWNMVTSEITASFISCQAVSFT